MPDPIIGTWRLIHGTCPEALKEIPDASVDAVVTDPPAGISFMGKDWDRDKGGRDAWIAWLREIMAECLRVLKPGGHALVWAIPRTSHWTATAVEDAGFDIRETVVHLFGSGFPKSLDVSKAIDEAAGAAREVISTKTVTRDLAREGRTGDEAISPVPGCRATIEVTSPATYEAKRWQGFGTALKPAAEFWILARKPLIGTVAQNVLAHGTGALNIDGCRVPSGKDHADKCASVVGLDSNRNGECYGDWTGKRTDSYSPAGRWPTNLVLTHDERCRRVGTKTVKGVQKAAGELGFGTDREDGYEYGTKRQYQPDAEVDVYECHPSCPVRLLDEKTAALHARGNREATTCGGGMYGHKPFVGQWEADNMSSGGASRFFPTFPADDEPNFFYCAKASRSERSAGLGDARNTHSTVKPITLMRWLCRLVTPPGGTILDPFAGSGTTLIAASLEGFDSIGVEMNEEYIEIAKKRLAHWTRPPSQPSLF